MDNWVAITLGNLTETKLAAYVTALQTAALGAGQEDPSPAIIQDVVNRIRAEVKGCVTNVLDMDQTKIPKDLKSLACRMVIREMKARLDEPLSEDERQEKRDDVKYLERICHCEVPISRPDNPQTIPEIQKGGATQVASQTTRHFTGNKMQGI